MTQLLTPELDVATIDVEEGFNARKHLDPEAVKRLASSVERTGVVGSTSGSEKPSDFL